MTCTKYIYITLTIFQSLRIVISCLNSFSIAVSKYSDRNILREKWFGSVHNSKLQSIPVEKPKQQDLKVDDHIVSTVGRG